MRKKYSRDSGEPARGGVCEFYILPGNTRVEQRPTLQKNSRVSASRLRRNKDANCCLARTGNDPPQPPARIARKGGLARGARRGQTSVLAADAGKMQAETFSGSGVVLNEGHDHHRGDFQDSRVPRHEKSKKKGKAFKHAEGMERKIPMPNCSTLRPGCWKTVTGLPCSTTEQPERGASTEPASNSPGRDQLKGWNRDDGHSTISISGMAKANSRKREEKRCRRRMVSDLLAPGVVADCRPSCLATVKRKR
ncbi:hypothetical protein WN48_08589 [Eufriesea mexicana]|nr:hypothetical protein WN48_08589 [Eufriesea mexicana]